MNWYNNISGDPLQVDTLAFLKTLAGLDAYRQRETARIVQAIRIANLTEQEALRLVVLRRQGFGAYQAVEIIMGERA